MGLHNSLLAPGFPFWTASILPAIIGTVLPYWLDPPKFSFKLFEGSAYLIATVLCHAGFSLMLSHYKTSEQELKEALKKINTSQHFWVGIFCLLGVIFIGLLLNERIVLLSSVYPYIFLVFGVGILFTGALYVFPPFSFYRHIGGEVVLYFGLGMMPVIGAYIVQVGDLTRTVYLASLPIVIATALWIWILELGNREQDQLDGMHTAVMLIYSQICGRIITPLILFALYASLVLDVIGRNSLHPFSLIALLSIILAVKIESVTWYRNSDINALMTLGKYPVIIHLIICIAIILSSIIPIFL